MELVDREFASTHPLHPPPDRQPEAGVTQEPGKSNRLFFPPRSSVEALVCLIRPGAVVALTMPVLIGMVLAWWETGRIAPVTFGFALLGAWSTVTGLNLLMEYYDFRRSRESDDAGIEPCLGSYCLMIHRLFPPRAVRLLGWLAVLLGVACTAALAVMVGWPVLFFYGLSLLIGFSAMLSPLRLAWRGWGIHESSSFVAYGLLQTLGGYYIQAQGVSLLPIWAGIPMGLLSVVVIHNANLVHCRRDWLGRKRTLAVYLGVARGLDLSALLALAAYVSVVLIVSMTRLPLWTLAMLGALPVMLSVYAQIRRDYLNSDDCVQLYRAGVHGSLWTALLLILALLLDGLLA